MEGPIRRPARVRSVPREHAQRPRGKLEALHVGFPSRDPRPARRGDRALRNEQGPSNPDGSRGLVCCWLLRGPVVFLTVPAPVRRSFPCTSTRGRRCERGGSAGSGSSWGAKIPARAGASRSFGLSHADGRSSRRPPRLDTENIPSFAWGFHGGGDPRLSPRGVTVEESSAWATAGARAPGRDGVAERRRAGTSAGREARLVVKRVLRGSRRDGPALRRGPRASARTGSRAGSRSGARGTDAGR